MSDFENTTQTIQHNTEKAFAPVIDAFKSVGSKLEVPEAARDFVKRSAEMAKDRASDIHTAYFASIGRIASAKSFSEAVQFQADYLRERSEVTMGRAKSVFEYVSGSLAEGARKAGETVSKATSLNQAA